MFRLTTRSNFPVFNNFIATLGRFLGVGLSGTIINLAALWLLIEFSVVPGVASLVATEISIIWNFILHDYWTFKSTKKVGANKSSLLTQFGRFIRFQLVSGLGTGLSLGLFILFNSGLHLHYLIAQTGAIGLTTIVNFSLNAWLTWDWFSKHKEISVNRKITASERTFAKNKGNTDLEAQRNRFNLENTLTAEREVMLKPGVEDRIINQGGKNPKNLKPGRLDSFRSSRFLNSYLPVIGISLVLFWFILSNLGAWVVVAAFFLGAAFLFRDRIEARKAIISLMAAGVLFSAVDYMSWRWQMVNWDAWWLALPLCLAETFGVLHILGFEYTVLPRPRPSFKAVENPTIHPIFIFIPTVNEGISILRPTVQAAKVARHRFLNTYPYGKVNIILCNDGFVAKAPCWSEVENLAGEMGVKCITRTVGGGAKAGNIEFARQQVGATGNALIVIFDADQIAHPDFLLKTVQPFENPRVGWVQTGQYYSNLENPVSKWANDQQALFYKILCPGKATQNAAFICGTNVVIRAAALDSIGGLPQESITEDFAASISLHPNWHSVFLDDVLATGLGPMDLPSYFKQQRRWAIGTLSVLRTHWKEIFLPSFFSKSQRSGSNKSLSFPQRIQYSMACTHYLCGIRDAIYIVAPLFFLLTGIPAVKGATLESFLWHFLPFWIASQVSFWYVAWGKTSLRGIVMGFGSFPVLIVSALMAFTGKSNGFAITAKKRSGRNSGHYLGLFLVISVVCWVSLILGLTLRTQDGPVLVSSLWVFYSICLLGGVLWLGISDLRVDKKRTKRTPAVEQTRLLAPRPKFAPSLKYVSGIVIVPLLIGVILFTNSNTIFGSAFGSAPVTFKPEQKNGQVQFGTSLPYQLLETGPALLKQELNTNLSIIGRTQDIGDSFNTAWANSLNAQNSVPWITLQFDISKKSYEMTPLDSSLVSIINGNHDAELQRWAKEIHDYGLPVYLTVLQHADKNWSISSGVTNGGIPQDVSEAWEHIRAVFKQENTTNVAWVWAPADPVNDQQFAPPTDQIDVTLLSLLNYPDTTWIDPQVALTAVSKRYPNKPIFLEISMSGNSVAQKVEWLNRLAAAIKNTPNVFSLLYHEGSPDPKSSADENAKWSVAADPDEVKAMSNVIVAINSKK